MVYRKPIIEFKGGIKHSSLLIMFPIPKLIFYNNTIIDKLITKCISRRSYLLENILSLSTVGNSFHKRFHVTLC